ncbi:hypothetical protein HDU76_008303 [Blyttiomyces sp. JEL0837]|nr:hypothetical protein HDU76_008303 [Blyttiomyces sp. JEL0837]
MESSTSSGSNHSLWDTLPYEIQHQILQNADPLTKFLNNILTPKEIEKYSIEIWKIAFALDWPGNLKCLPSKGLARINDGLELATTRTMYKRLCDLRRNTEQGDDWIDELDRELDLTSHYDKLKLFVIAASFGHRKLVQRLVQIVAKPVENMRPFENICGATLYEVAMGGHCEVMELLLQTEGLNRDQNGFIKMVRMMIRLELVDPASFENEAIISAATYGRLDIVELLLGLRGVDATADDNKALRGAATDGHLHVIKRLLQVEGVRADACDNEAVRLATCYGQLDVLKFLLTLEGVDVTAMENEAFGYAAQNGHLEVVQLLLDIRGVDPTAYDNMAIISAAGNGYTEVVKLLLQVEGVDASAENNLKNHRGISMRTHRLNGVDPSASGNEALQRAAANGNLGVVKLLLRSENVDATANDNYALKMAMKNGHEKIVKLLLDNRDFRTRIGLNNM